ARDVGMRIVIAAKVAEIDRAYYETAIRPMVDASPLAEFVGEVDEAGKDELLGGAYACLFPIDWPEPFGLTMIESMATGTPVIASRNGSVPEVIVDGVTGFVCDSFRGMVEAVERASELDRAKCREHVEQNFSPATMAARYEAVYQSVVESKKARVPIPLKPSRSRRSEGPFHVPRTRAG
ncbi:MAG TPA: glycosyltransferase, partial [Dehalococcoidia bacterium]